ncbi:thioredoxin reductase [Candidatus Pacearchaeota archaeon]|nr:MAG: thioredoxin reductase [Candidatus Pacearchaeota archaeon]
MKKVIIYSTPQCPWCKKTKKLLSEIGVDFTDYDVSSDKDKANEMMKKSGQNGVPVLDIDGEIVVGYNPEKIKELLSENKNEKKEYSCDVLIIGSGVSGLAAAMYSGRFDLKTIVVGDTPGGVITLTNEISNYPGFKNLTGTELADKIREHALEYGVEIFTDKITKVSGSYGNFISESSDSRFLSKTVIFATGTKARKLNVPGEDDFFGRGVHTCALCDGPFYKDKTVAVVGGSDSAAKEALLLTEYAKKVYIIYRGEKIHPEPINEKRVKENQKIEIITNTNIVEIKGEKNVSRVVLDREYNGDNELKLDGLFIEIGHIPLSYVAEQMGVLLNEKNEIKINRNSETNIEGVFAAGDVVDSAFKQAITGVAEGVTAAWSAYQLISSKG